MYCMRVYVYVNVYIYVFVLLKNSSHHQYIPKPMAARMIIHKEVLYHQGGKGFGFGLLSGSNGFDIRGTRAALFSEKTSSEAVPVPMFGMISGEGHIRGTRFKLHRSKDFTQT